MLILASSQEFERALAVLFKKTNKQIKKNAFRNTWTTQINIKKIIILRIKKMSGE